MDTTNNLKEQLSTKEFNGFYIPRHNAKVIKESLENNFSPLLPDSQDQLKAIPIYNANTGYCLPATTLIPVQIERNTKGFKSVVVGTSGTLKNAGTQKLKGQKGIWYNFKNKDGEIHSAQYIFPEQVEKPENFINLVSGKLKDKQTLNNLSLQINTPEQYLACYLASAKSGISLKVTPEVTKAFKEQMLVICNNEMANKAEKKQNMLSLNETLFAADVKANELIKKISVENGITKEKKIPEKKQEMSIER